MNTTSTGAFSVPLDMIILSKCLPVDASITSIVLPALLISGATQFATSNLSISSFKVIP